MKTLLVVVALLVASAGIVRGEVEKHAIPSEQGLNLHWWPKLPLLPGWHHDRKFSLRYGANALAPDGFDFAKADTVIYARALYKPRIPETKTLEALIESDRSTFLASDSTIIVSDAPSLTTADGQRMRSVTFFPKDKGNWERVTYGEEGEYYLIFTVSARSLDGYRKARGAYEGLVANYRAKLDGDGKSEASAADK